MNSAVDRISTWLYQAAAWFVCFYGGSAFALYHTVNMFEHDWHEHGWRIIFWIPVLILRTLSDSWLIVAISLVIAFLIVGFLGRRYHRREAIRDHHRLKVQRIDNQAAPHVLTYRQQQQLAAKIDRDNQRQALGQAARVVGHMLWANNRNRHTRRTRGDGRR